jgi:hypothetical protein
VIGTISISNTAGTDRLACSEEVNSAPPNRSAITLESYEKLKFGNCYRTDYFEMNVQQMYECSTSRNKSQIVRESCCFYGYFLPL